MESPSTIATVNFVKEGEGDEEEGEGEGGEDRDEDEDEEIKADNPSSGFTSPSTSPPQKFVSRREYKKSKERG